MSADNMVDMSQSSPTIADLDNVRRLRPVWRLMRHRTEGRAADPGLHNRAELVPLFSALEQPVRGQGGLPLGVLHRSRRHQHVVPHRQRLLHELVVQIRALLSVPPRLLARVR